MISTSELREWKAHPVTEAFMIAIAGMEQDVIERLIQNAEGDLSDDFYRGYIFALRDVIKVDLSEE